MRFVVLTYRRLQCEHFLFHRRFSPMVPSPFCHHLNQPLIQHRDCQRPKMYAVNRSKSDHHCKDNKIKCTLIKPSKQFDTGFWFCLCFLMLKEFVLFKWRRSLKITHRRSVMHIDSNAKMVCGVQ